MEGRDRALLRQLRSGGDAPLGEAAEGFPLTGLARGGGTVRDRLNLGGERHCGEEDADREPAHGVLAWFRELDNRIDRAGQRQPLLSRISRG